MPRRIQSAALAKGLIGLKGLIDAAGVIVGQIRGAVTGRGTLGGGFLQSHLLSGTALGAGALAGALANLLSGAVLGSGVLAGAPQAGAWYDDPAHAPLAAVMDFNNDRYALPLMGSELVTNGDFSAGTTGWTNINGTSSTVSGGQAHYTGQGFATTFTQNIPFVEGNFYEITFTVTAFTTGSIKFVLLGGAGLHGTVRSAVGTYTQYITAPAGLSQISMAVNSSPTTCSFDNISVKEVILTATGRTYGSELIVNGGFDFPGSELALNGDFAANVTDWEAKFDGTISWSAGRLRVTATGGGSAGRALQTVTGLTIGKVYKLSVTSAAQSASDNIQVVVGIASSGSVTGAVVSGSSSNVLRTDVLYFTATQTTHYILMLHQATSGWTEFDNVSLKESGWLPKATAVGTETMTISGGTLNLTGDGTNSAWADQSFTTVASQVYEMTLTYVNSAALSIGTSQGGTQIGGFAITGGASAQTTTFKFTATGTTTWLRLARTSASLHTVDNVSIRALTAVGTYPKREATFDECFLYTCSSDSARTYVDSGGTLRSMTYGRTNHSLYSNDFAQATWLTYNGTSGAATKVGASGTGPDGNPAYRITFAATAGLSFANSAAIYQTGSWTTAPWTYSVYARSLTGAPQTIRIGLNIGGSTDLTVTTSWTRLSYSETTGSVAANVSIRAGSAGAAVDIEIAQFQIEPGLSLSNYVPTTTAFVNGGVNARRMTYANAKRQLRLENQSTNLHLRSDDFSTGWTLTNLTTSTDGTLTPWATTATKFTTTGSELPYYTAGQTIVAATTYTVSAFVKRGSLVWGRIVVANDGAFVNQARAWFNFQTGVAGTSSVTGSGYAIVGTPTITAIGGGWYRVAMSFTYTGTTNEVSFVSSPSDGATTRDTTGVSWYMGGFQVEATAFATDYIPVPAGSTVNRAIETARLSPLLEAVLQRAQGSVVVRGDLTNTTATNRRMVGSDTTSYFLGASSTKTQAGLFSAATSVTATLGSGTNDDAFGAAMGFDASGRAAVANGGTVATDANAMGTRAAIYLGRDVTVAANTYGDGYYDLLGISPERLPPANLQSLAVAA